MGRRKLTRDQRRAAKKRKAIYLKKYHLEHYDQKKEWNSKLKLLANITPPRNSWPKTKKVSWETLPDVIFQLDRDGLIPTQMKTRKVDVWDPCYFNGKVQKTWQSLGISMHHTCQNFWKVWHNTITPRTVIVTNPPFVKAWLEPFFTFLAILDNPFILILQNKAPDRLYFGRNLFDRIQRKSELHIFHLQKSFRMKQKGGRLAGFSGLTLCCYYPKQWKFELDESKYVRVIEISSLHATH